jgi:hypothetical protein
MKWIVMLGLLLFPVSDCSAAPFSVKDASLREAASQASKVLGKQVVIAVDQSHPAHKLRVTLSMEVAEDNDLLNALAATFQLRWWNGSKRGTVELVSKQAYRPTAKRPNSRGLRQSVADALPEGDRHLIVGGDPGERKVQGNWNRETEDRLHGLDPSTKAALELYTANRPVKMSLLPKGIYDSLLRYLDGYAAFLLGMHCDSYCKALTRTIPEKAVPELGKMCDAFCRTLLNNRATPPDVQYTKSGSTKVFRFISPTSEILVAPE